MTAKPATPAYLVDYENIHNLLSQKFQQWAFEVAPTGQSVHVTHRSNIGCVRRILADAGYKDVRVSG